MEPLINILIKEYMIPEDKAEETARAILKRQPPPTIQMQVGPDRMPVFDKADELNQTLQGLRIQGKMEEGGAPSAHMFQGLTPEQIMEALGRGAQLREWGGKPYSSDLAPVPGAAGPKVVQGPWKGGPPVLQIGPGEEPLDIRMKRARAYDEFVQKVGWQPELFKDKTDLEALRMISDQLQAQRERNGDPTAWWATGPSI